MNEFKIKKREILIAFMESYDYPDLSIKEHLSLLENVESANSLEEVKNIIEKCRLSKK
jgi:hypothetical protein